MGDHAPICLESRLESNGVCGGRDKLGGVRVIYFYRCAQGEIWLLAIYAKNEVRTIPGHVLRRLREEIGHGQATQY